MPTDVEFESSLSLAMLEEALTNPQIKFILTEIASRLRNEILLPIIEREQAGLPTKLLSIAKHHAKGDKLIGALLPDYTSEYLAHTPAGRALLLTTIDHCLKDANLISTHHDFIALMKAIDGMACIYNLLEADKENLIHLKCSDYILPTAEEVAIRVKRPDDLLATTYGSGTEIGIDLALKKEVTAGCLSGKARFFISPVTHRSVTWFEKLADQSSMGKSPLPLIASPSSSTARSIIMSLGMNLFVTDGIFDINRAQIFANCLMAYFVYCGHHSFLETIEIWNRELDFLVIEYPEQLPSGIIPSDTKTSPYMEQMDAVERKLPYAIIGNYSNFLNETYADKVIERAHSQLKGLDLRFNEDTLEVRLHR